MKDDPLQKHDIALFDKVDLPAALGLLTRLPVVVNGDRAITRGAASAWAYPLVGMVVGIILAALVAVMVWIGLPAGIVAGLVLAASVVITGAMHEDGLADTADGLWGGWDRDRRLAIMKDSHIGVYGVCAIALSLLLRWLALVVVISVGAHWVAFTAVVSLCRASIVGLMAVLPHARAEGLSKSVGKPSVTSSWGASGLACCVALLVGYPLLILVAGLAAVICGLVARAKIGGQTGDILGATQQVTEVTMLIALVVMVT